MSAPKTIILRNMDNGKLEAIANMSFILRLKPQKWNEDDIIDTLLSLWEE